MTQRMMRKRAKSDSFSNLDIFTLKMSLIFFKISGIAPFTVKTSKTLKKNNGNLYVSTFCCSSLSTIYNLSLIICSSVINSYCLYHMSGMDYMFDSEMGHIIEVTIGAFSIFVMILIWSCYTYNRKIIVEIANRLIDIDIILATYHSHYFEKRHLHLFFIFVINGTMSGILFITELLSYNFEITRIITFVIPIFVVSLTIIQYSSVLQLLKQRFEHLNNALINLIMFEKFKTEISMISSEPIVGKIVCLRKTHSELWELCQQVANFYSVPVLFTITLMSGSIIYSAYYVVIPFVLPLRYHVSITTVAAVMWFLMQILPIIVMTTTVSSTTTEMKKIGTVIHKLITQNHINHDVRIQLRDFSLEMLRKKVNFTAYNFFPLDCTLLQSIFSATMTYLIILLQLKSRANPVNDHAHHHAH